MYLRSAVTAYITNASGHIGKTLNCFGKVLNGFFGVAVFNAVAHAVLNMPFQHNLPYAVQCRFGGVNLHKNILAGHIFVNHSVNSLHLADNFFQAAVQIVSIHTLSHLIPPIRASDASFKKAKPAVQ